MYRESDYWGHRLSGSGGGRGAGVGSWGLKGVVYKVERPQKNLSTNFYFFLQLILLLIIFRLIFSAQNKTRKSYRQDTQNISLIYQ